MLKRIGFFLFMLGFSLPTLAQKARQKALQLDASTLNRITANREASDFPLIDQSDPKLPLEKLKLPEGVTISIFAVVPNARSMTLGEKGQVFVGSRRSQVYRVWDPNLDGKADRVEQIFTDLNSPNGVAYRDGTLYIAEIPRVIKVPKVNEKKKADLKYEVLPQKFPTDGHHGWKYIRFGPDGWLYVPVGANCNVCDPKAAYARIFRINVAGTEKEEVAQGIRNTVGFDWDPATKELWFTDNGRDLLGDDLPPDELNKVSRKGEHFGFPFCYGKEIQDPEFKKPCAQFTPPQTNIPAHVAALGMKFHKEWIYIAQHGSWNRSVPQGYQVSRVKVSQGKAQTLETWIEGWLQDGKAWGRPVDVLTYFDGSLLVSDDDAGVIYRVQGL
jgi:glucose/arabinose dehydrogenase